MNSAIQKFATEPLVWVAAAVICLPLLGANSLKHLRGYLTYDSTNSHASTRLSASEGTEIELASVANSDSVKREWKSDVEVPMASLPLPPVPTGDSDSDFEAETTEEYEASEYSPVSLPASDPEMASSDPGSLLEFSGAFEQEDEIIEERELKSELAESDAESKIARAPANSTANSDDNEFDFLFGDEEAPTVASVEPSVPDISSVEQPPIDQPSMDQPKEGDPTWLFPKPDGQGAAQSQIADSQLEGSIDPELELPPSGLELTPSDMPQSVFAPEVAPPLDEFAPLMPEAPTMEAPAMAAPEMHSFTDQNQSDYYIELEAGTDWWTPHCQQAIWQSVPARQTGLDGIVFTAIQNSPYVKMLNTEPQMAQTIVDEADALFDWSAFVETSWSDVDRPVVSLLDTGTAGGRFVQQQLLFESGVKKNLRSGGHLRVGHAWQRTDNNSIFLSPPDQATAQLLLDYRQPLMRGAGKHITNNQIVLAQLDVEATHNNSQALLQQFLVDVVTEYWELHFARGVLMQKLRCAERAEQLLNEISSLPQVATRNRDLVRIQAVVAARRTELIRAKNQIATHQEKLLNLTYGASMPDSSSLEVVPVESPGMFVVPYDLAHVTQMAVQNRAEVKVALAAIRASAIRQNLALNDLKPRLDAIVSTFISGVDEHKDVPGALGDAFGYNPSYAVGLSFEMPLGRRAANARLSRQQLDYQRLQHQLQQTLGNVRLDARLAWRDVSSIATEMENQKLAVHQAGQELQYATQQAALGVSQSAENTSFLIDDLLRSQEGLAVAESRLLRSQTDLSISLVKLKRATGQLLQAAPIPQVSDHSVQQASYEQPVSFAQQESFAGSDSLRQPNGVDSVWQGPMTNGSPQVEASDLWTE